MILIRRTLLLGLIGLLLLFIWDARQTPLPPLCEPPACEALVQATATVPLAVIETPTPVPAPPTATPYLTVVDGSALIRHYGSTRFDSLDSMPPEVRDYLTVKIQEIAAFFNVRPQDLLLLMQAQNEGGFRLQAPDASQGVMRIPPALWNGWALPPDDPRPLSDLRAIEQQGGIGFDWTMRELWQRWQAGRYDGSGLTRTTADPARFENSVAAAARYLARQGLTQAQAEADPLAFSHRLVNAIAALQSGTVRLGRPQLPAEYRSEQPVPADALRDAYRSLIDQSFGVTMEESLVAEVVDRSTVAAQVQAGSLGVDEGAYELLDATIRFYQAHGEAAHALGMPLSWPFIKDEESLMVQRLAVDLLGHTLAAGEVDALLAQGGGREATIRRELASWAESRLFVSARLRLKEELGREIRVQEVSQLVQPALAGQNPEWMDTGSLQQAMDQVEHSIRLLPEFRARHGIKAFVASPLSPMPRVSKPFGARVSYQPNGVHTGIDLRNRRVGGQEPPLFAVDEAIVVHVGPIYCDQPRACRGSHAIILDHGNHVYSIYSHNSEATVQVGEQVQPGQQIGRQGNEGYSRGSHLHFEVHVGAPYSGDWRQPFHGGEFINPLPWLPRGGG